MRPFLQELRQRVTDHQQPDSDTEDYERCTGAHATFSANAVRVPDVELAFGMVCLAMPEDDLDVVLFKRNLLTILCSEVSWLIRVMRPGEKWLLLLAADVAARPFEEIVGVVAHELGHVVLGHHRVDTTFLADAEFAACKKAIEWGFGPEIMVLLDSPWGQGVARTDELADMAGQAPEA